MVDANSNIIDKGFGEFLAESQLYDMTGAKHRINSPKMHIKGSKEMDFLCGTEEVIGTVVKIGMLKLFENIASDHQGQFCDLNKKHLLRGE
eukprot:11179898-Ditylum_brightwellii.AAC.1